jgi:hypothetical protein
MTWKIDGCISMQNLDIVRGDNRIAMLDCENEALCDGDILANAKLIAAAPDLLQALTWLACEADEDMPSEYRTNSFRAALDSAFEAIDKAKGADA